MGGVRVTNKLSKQDQTGLPNNRLERDAAKSAAPLKRNVRCTIQKEAAYGIPSHIVQIQGI